MMLPDKCPKCAADLLKLEDEGKKAIQSGSPGWTRAFLVVQNNRAFAFKCPDCQHEWPMPWMTRQQATDLE